MSSPVPAAVRSAVASPTSTVSLLSTATETAAPSDVSPPLSPEPPATPGSSGVSEVSSPHKRKRMTAERLFLCERHFGSHTPPRAGFDDHVGRFVAWKEDEKATVRVGVVATRTDDGLWQMQVGDRFTSYEDCNAQKRSSRVFTHPVDIAAWEREGKLAFIDEEHPGYNPLPLLPVRRALVLCSGTGHDAASLARLFPDARVDTLDNDPECRPTFLTDVMDWEYRSINPGTYQVVYASPPCTPFSRANTTGDAEQSVFDIAAGTAVAARCLEIIEHLAPPVWIVENPVNKLAEQKVMRRYDRHLKTTSYCHWGALYKKPTNVWTNVSVSLPRCTKLTPCPVRQRAGRHPRTSQQGPARRSDGTVAQGTPPREAQKMPFHLLRHVLSRARRIALPPALQAAVEVVVDERFACTVCRRTDGEDEMLLCDCCDKGFHMKCLPDGPTTVPPGDWYCAECEGTPK